MKKNKIKKNVLLILGMTGFVLIPSSFSHFIGGVVLEGTFRGVIQSMPPWTALSLGAILLL